jgi:hypothetical protein
VDALEARVVLQLLAERLPRDDDVELPRDQARQGRLRLLLVQVHLHARVRGHEGADGRSHERRARGEERADAQQTGLHTGNRAHVGLGGPGRAEDRPGVRVQALTRGRQPYRALAALEERHAELPLELRDVVTHHGLRVVERERGARERAPLGYLVEDRQPPHIQHRSTRYFF